jgi:hypothetical protein
MKIRAGTQIEVSGFGWKGERTAEPARITRRTKDMGTLPDGYFPVRFAADGAHRLVHHTNFRVIDNRA